MQNFMAILAQLFWGVTIGALTTAFETLARSALAVVGLGGAGWLGMRWRQRKRRDSRD